ncbi:MAG: PorT family protein [Bacteroidales bacterium]|nr:PorT family protein [Candidatus Cacconaster merdequi]
MKKLLIAFAALAFLLSAETVSAEGVFIKGGLTYSNSSSAGLKEAYSMLRDLNFKSYTGWHAGIGYQTGSIMGFSFQPELLYNVKGSSLSDNMKWKMSYIEVPVNIQYGIDLLVARPFIFISPYVGLNLSNKVSVSSSNSTTTLKPIDDFINDTVNKLEYGFGLGAGIDIARFQVTAKYSWNFGNVLDFSEYKQNITHLKSATGGLELSIALKF